MAQGTMAVAFAAGLGLAGNTWAGDIRVTIENVPSNEGRVLVAACAENVYLKASCSPSAEAPAVPDTMVLTIPDVPAGSWGLVALHDLNGNGQFDFVPNGAPAESYGYSNNPPPRQGPALWDDIVITVGPDPGEVRIRLIGG